MLCMLYGLMWIYLVYIQLQIKSHIIASINIAGGILDFAEENNIDLIVIGTQGSSYLKNYYLEELRQIL